MRDIFSQSQKNHTPVRDSSARVRNLKHLYRGASSQLKVVRAFRGPRRSIGRFAPVSVTLSNPDEGAPGSSPLGTGDRRLTLHRRQASSRRDELIIAQDEVLGMRTNRFPPPRRVRNESPQAVILVHALAPDQGSREYQNAVFTTPKTCQKRAFLAQKQH